MLIICCLAPDLIVSFGERYLYKATISCRFLFVEKLLGHKTRCWRRAFCLRPRSSEIMRCISSRALELMKRILCAHRHILTEHRWGKICWTSGLGKHPAARGEAGFGHISQKLKVKGNQQNLQVFASLSMTNFFVFKSLNNRIHEMEHFVYIFVYLDVYICRHVQQYS